MPAARTGMLRRLVAAAILTGIAQSALAWDYVTDGSDSIYAGHSSAMLTATGASELPHDAPDELGGFFLVQVADSAEAFRIARECPHLKHGGTVQVRRIEPT